MFTWTKTKFGIEITNTTLDTTGVSRVVLYLDDEYFNIPYLQIADYLTGVYKISRKYAGVWWLTEYELRQISTGSYTIGDNTISRTGILAEVDQYIFADKIYEVDIEESTANQLWLTRPIEGDFYSLFTATKFETSVNYMYPVEQEIKKRLLKFSGCPDGDAYDAQAYLSAFNSQAEYNNHESKKMILNKIKDTLNIRC